MKKFAFLVLAALAMTGCTRAGPEPIVSRGGVRIAETQVEVGSDGLTTEQRNIKARLEADNKPGAIKHLYIISSMSGQCILYSTVKGKVTSSGKRLTPYTVAPLDGQSRHFEAGFPFNVAGTQHYTSEVIQDDGTFGTSLGYIFWWDVRGVYHQHYVTSQIVHISSEPMPVRNITINVEEEKK